jgi:hypothetical protein
MRDQILGIEFHIAVPISVRPSRITGELIFVFSRHENRYKIARIEYAIQVRIANPIRSVTSVHLWQNDAANFGGRLAFRHQTLKF